MKMDDSKQFMVRIDFQDMWFQQDDANSHKANETLFYENDFRTE